MQACAVHASRFVARSTLNIVEHSSASNHALRTLFKAASPSRSRAYAVQAGLSHQCRTCCNCRATQTPVPHWANSRHVHTSLPSTLTTRYKSTSAVSENSEDSAAAATSTSSPDDRFTRAAEEELLQAPRNGNQGQAIGRMERRLSITFTCTVPSCGHRSSHEFSRQAYEKGIVLCQCPQCESRHLIADHLGWFDSDDLTQGGKYKTIEALLAAKGEQVARARVNPDGTLEVERNEAV